MKQLLTILFTAISLTAFAQSETFIYANQLYSEQNYQEAALLYQELLQTNTSAEIYYNLGNCYFKLGDLSQSILAYERALRIRPYYNDAKHNLRFAESRIIDNIEDNRGFFISDWIRALRDVLDTSTWLWISIALFILMLLGIMGFAFLTSTASRKASFHIAWLALMFTIITFSFSLSLHKQNTLRREAIITREMVNAKSSPDRSGTDLFLLHEGTKVTIHSTLSDWAEIHVGNNIGWISLAALERI